MLILQITLKNILVSPEFTLLKVFDVFCKRGPLDFESATILLSQHKETK